MIAGLTARHSFTNTEEVAGMTTKEAQNTLVSDLRRWQKIEDVSVASTAQVAVKTANPLIRLLMDVIMRDSQMHYRVQEFIINSIEREAVSLTSDELADVWMLIEDHLEIERKSVELAEEAIERLEGLPGMVVQEYLLSYLLEDERKHTELLSRLNAIKRGVYRSV